MVLESLLNVRDSEHKPWHIFVITLVYTVVSIFFAYKIFPSQASLLSVALITILFVPFFQKLFSQEETKDSREEGNLFTRHKQVIFIYSAFFLGVIVAMSFVYTFVPQLDVFGLQTLTLENLLTGNYSGVGGFIVYFLNNSQTMILSFILSVMFGTGAVFILSWNASVIAVFLGFHIKELVGVGFGHVEAYLYGIPMGLGAIALHGIPEIAAYFFAGLAGGILSVGLIRENYGTKEFWSVTKDAIVYLLIAELLIVGAAYLEAFV